MRTFDSGSFALAFAAAAACAADALPLSALPPSPPVGAAFAVRARAGDATAAAGRRRRASSPKQQQLVVVVVPPSSTLRMSTTGDDGSPEEDGGNGAPPDDGGEKKKKKKKQTGRVKWFNTLRGYGFITPSSSFSSGDVFVHQTAIQTEGFRSLADGEEVEYRTEIDDGGRVMAVDVTGPGGREVRGAPFDPGSDFEEF